MNCYGQTTVDECCHAFSEYITAKSCFCFTFLPSSLSSLTYDTNETFRELLGKKPYRYVFTLSSEVINYSKYLKKRPSVEIFQI